jgi:hypothetical protein
MITDWNQLFTDFRQALADKLPFIRCIYVPARRFQDRIYFQGEEITLSDTLGDYIYITLHGAIRYTPHPLLTDRVTLQVPLRMVILTHEADVFRLEALIRTLLLEMDGGAWAKASVGVRIEEVFLEAEHVFTQETKRKDSFPSILEHVTLYACNLTLEWDTMTKACALPVMFCENGNENR